MGLRHLFAAGMGLVLAGMAAAEEAPLQPHRVTADSVNLRAGPDTRYETVCQADAGETVLVSRVEGDWAEVAAPDRADLWIYGELAPEGVVAANQVQVRGGPGINYRPVGKVDAGLTLQVRETFGDWLRIAPPPGCRLWMSTNYLESVSREPAAEAPPAVVSAPRPAVPPRPAPAAPAVPAAAAPRPPQPAAPAPPPATPGIDEADYVPAALARRELDRGRVQGERVEMQGRLESSGWAWGRLGAYRLVAPGRRGRLETVCYLLGNEEQLEGIRGRTVTVYGRRYWVVKVRYPGIRPEKILVHP